MAYIQASDFRTGTVAEYCAGIELTTDEAPDPNLSLAITRMAQRFDDLTNDHFESENLTLDVDGDGTSKLILPWRCTGIASAQIRLEDGTLGTAEDSSVYRLHSSLFANGSRKQGDFDWIELVKGGAGLANIPATGSATVYRWPTGPQTVRVVGTFGWTSTPADVKRAVALLVYDHFKPQSDVLRLSDRWAAENATFTRSQSTPTGLPEVDEIIADYKREAFVGVG